MNYSVCIYCPDSHLVYDLAAVDKQGIGGGASTRVHMAYALAARGQTVTLFINCRKERTAQGVQMRHFGKFKENTADVFIASTSGGGLNLSSLKDKDLGRSLKILLIHGVDRPKGVDAMPFDFYYAPSNFIRQVVISDWGVSPKKVFTTHRGIREEYYQGRRGRLVKRDPYALVYAGHPSKGLEAAVAVFHQLKKLDSRYSLHVFGGHGLWGEEEHPERDPLVTWHGIIGQQELAIRLQSCSISLHLQNRLEPFGKSVIEAMRAGCIPIASHVGAYPEVVVPGWNGFLVKGDPLMEEVQHRTAALIHSLAQETTYTGYLRKNATQTPLTWDTVASTWEGHWKWAIQPENRKSLSGDVETCPECGGDWLLLADGLHCSSCGNYQQRLAAAVYSRTGNSH